MAEQSQSPVRREALQRVQVGLAGFGAVLLVVAFVNIVVKTVRPDFGASIADANGQSGTSADANGIGADSEPFADLGVTPKSDQPVSPSVPDLEPDPRLSKPMDRDPKRSGQQR